MDDTLAKLQALLNFLNIGEDGKYRFYDQENKEKRQNKLAEKVTQMTSRTLQVLEELLSQIQEKNETIAKI